MKPYNSSYMKVSDGSGSPSNLSCNTYSIVLSYLDITVLPARAQRASVRAPAYAYDGPGVGRYLPVGNGVERSTEEQLPEIEHRQRKISTAFEKTEFWYRVMMIQERRQVARCDSGKFEIQGEAHGSTATPRQQC